MTKPEITGSREGDLRFLRWLKEKFPGIEIDEKDKDLRVSIWIRSKLPDSRKEGLRVEDVDFDLYNDKTKRMMLLEVKTRNAEVEFPQDEIFKDLHRWIKKGIKSSIWNYLGFHSIKFEKEFFGGGKCFWDKAETTEEELINQFS
ncbi:hypothetical protein ES708_31556 [subsurface metagenome]